MAGVPQRHVVANRQGVSGTCGSHMSVTQCHQEFHGGMSPNPNPPRESNTALIIVDSRQRPQGQIAE
uniref:Uncharacterized protein n=1 Tax=Oryza rufipogon TaxID=4529 RepID=A0A0E0P7H9_ORYRU